jgi:prepilin-type N-terminal cleavage/methylation domain-containing protein
MNKLKKAGRKGFTLIELLVVIAILAVLAVVVVLTLNPAGLLQEARDSNRISDMATLKSGISLYLADVPSPFSAPSAPLPVFGDCYLSIPTATGLLVPITKNTTQASTTCVSWFGSQLATSTSNPVTSTPIRTTSGLGWIPINMSLLSAGSPFAAWPVDPLNTAGYFYSFIATSSNTTFKIGMFMESTKYEASGTADVVGTDGGSNPLIFEGGNNLSL